MRIIFISHECLIILYEFVIRYVWGPVASILSNDVFEKSCLKGDSDTVVLVSLFLEREVLGFSRIVVSE